MSKPVQQLDDVVVRFAGDSGDGMQLTGDRFTSETAALGNDLSTLPDYPAEIRAPAGSLPGVSGFQIHFSDHDILTPGDRPNVLVAMNPAALKTNLGDLPEGGTLIVNRDAFNERNLSKAGYEANPLEDGTVDDYKVHAIPLTTMTVEALKDVEGVTPREAERAKNFFALGLMSWLYGRPIDTTLDFIDAKFGKRPEIAEANTLAFRAGVNYGETSEDFLVSYQIKPAPLAPGTYRNITGNQALALGLVAAGVQSGLPLFLGAYPITPASGILEELARHKQFGVRTFQAEDEIAACRSRARRVVRRRSRHHHLGRARHRAQGRDRRARRHAGAAAADRRRAARRPVHRDADEARAGRPADGAVRPELGVAGAGDRVVDPRRLLRHGARGRAHRAQVPDARLPALRRVPRERLRAVADPGRGVTARHLDRARDQPPGRRPVPALLARPGDARPAVGRARYARAGAPDRRAREGGRHRQHLVRPGQPRPHGPATRAEGRRDRRRHPRARGGRPGRRRPARARLGRHVRPDRSGRAQGARRRRQRRARASPLPQPVPAQHGRRARDATTACSCPR